MKKFILYLTILISYETYAQETDFRAYYKKGIEAYKAKNYPAFYAALKQANELYPYHQGIFYQLGLAAALTGHSSEAIDNLKKSILIDNSFKIEGITDFNSLKGMPAFTNLIKLQKEWSLPIIHSDTALIIKDRSLHCEGLEYDPETKIFYAGSIHQRKIVMIKNGIEKDFCVSGVDGMTSIFGLKIDTKKKLLWACASPVAEMENFDSAARSAVFKFDLTTGKLLEKFKRPTWEKDGVFGDLTLNKDGEVFISDGQTNTVFKINEKTHQLEPYYTSPDFINLQGLAFSEKDKYLFIADYVKGLFKLDTKTKTLININCHLDISLTGIDGLCYYDHSLIAIQNGITPLRVTRYKLDSSQDQITSFDIIDRKHPAFNEPTLGVIHDDVFYYIANSQWGGYDEHHKLKAKELLQDVVILEKKL